jgi:RNA polymerase sigma factor FliA
MTLNTSTTPTATPKRRRQYNETHQKALWEEYAKNPTKEIRNQLILEYAPLVRYIAKKISINLPPSLDEADLVSFGMFGLVDAINKFDTTRGLQFQTYAMNRIRGSIIDELRHIDWVPRSVRQKMRKVELATQTLDANLGRIPTEQEIADQLGVTTKQYQQMQTQFTNAYITSLDTVILPGETGQTLGERMKSDSFDAPDNAYETTELKLALAKAVKYLPERERVVISLYYFENLTLNEIGQVLGVTESRVCQIHAHALTTLKTAV